MADLFTMHELTITESILEITLRHAREAQASCVTDVHLVIGELSSVVDDSVQFYWDFISENTPAQGARLHFRRIAAELCCRECQHNYSPKESLTCPACSSNRIRVVAGDEFYLEAIEVSHAEAIRQQTS